MKPIEYITDLIETYYNTGNGIEDINYVLSDNYLKMRVLRDAICQVLELDYDKFLTNRGHKYAKGRSIFAYMVYEHWGFSPNEAMKMVGKDRTQFYWIRERWHLKDKEKEVLLQIKAAYQLKLKKEYATS